MAKQNWEALQAQFLAAHAETGVSPKEWCEAQGLRFSSAKRYIKIAGRETANSQKKITKIANRKTANSQPVVSQKPTAEKPSSANHSTPDHSIESRQGMVPDPSDYGLSDQQAVFAEAIVSGMTRIDAYKKAHYKAEGDHSYQSASRMYRDVKVSRYIHALRNHRQARYQIELDDVISQLIAIINADPNEVAQYRRVNCRHCWGDGYKYQWRDIAEQLQAEAKNLAANKPPPDISGGIGFISNTDPNPKCPHCNGEGEGDVFFADTRDIEGDARHLLQGVKVGKCGVEILIADKDAARRELARLLAINGTDSRQVELAIQRLELQNEKLRAEIEDIHRNAPPSFDDEDEADGFEIEFIGVKKDGEDADPVE